MKKTLSIIVIILSFTAFAQAQDAMKKSSAKVISFTQIPGEFTEKTKTVKAGAYIFEITNDQAGTDVGFVLVPKGKDISKPENHIKTAYVTTVVKEGATEKSQATQLKKGEYVYFCPLNNTATNNTLVVQ